MDRQNKVVMVVEDDDDMVSLLLLMFREYRFQLVPIATGAEGLEAMHVLQPDLVLLDIMMPGMDGWAVYKQMRLSPHLREIPVIILTARSEGEARALGQHFDDVVAYVDKPFTPRALINLVEQSLASTSARAAPGSSGHHSAESEEHNIT